MEISIDEVDRNGVVINGFDYYLQAWVKGGIIQDCNHPQSWKEINCCNAHRLAGRKIKETAGHEQRFGEISMWGKSGTMR